MAVATQQPQLLTVPTLAGMSPSARTQYASQFTDPRSRAQAQADVAAAKAMANADYLARSEEKEATCPPTSGGIQQNYAQGQTLIYNFPTAQGAFMKGLLFRCQLTVTIATTGGTPALNAGGPLSLFDNIEILLNGTTQAKIKPFILKYLWQMAGYQRPVYGPSTVISGQSDATLQNALFSTFPVATGANTWNFFFFLPLTSLHYHSSAGILPMMGTSTPGQIKVVCASNNLGVDPILNTVTIAGGTSNSVTVTGTVRCEAVYTDGTNTFSPSNLYLDLNGEPTAQYIIDNVLSPLSATTVQRVKIASLLQHYNVLAVIVDGNQSNLFAARSNILGLGLDQDSVGQNVFWRYGQNTNQDINDFWYMRVRRWLGQDQDAGVVPFCMSNVMYQQNPSNREGMAVLNMQPGGWVDTNLEFYLNSVGSVSGINPRVEIYLTSLNPAGLVLTQ